MNKEKKSKSETKETPILKFFSNPLVGIIGTTASIIGVILAVIFYIQGKEIRKLMFYEQPGKAIIAKAGHSSKIEILIEGKQIKTDVTAAQVAFWNDGKKSIRPENILRPLILKTKDKIPIVEAKIRKKSREVIEIDIDETKKNEGEIKISWKILEKNDGGIIQITYLGSPEISIGASAIIEGQGEVETNTINQLKKKAMRLTLFNIVLLSMTLIFVILFSRILVYSLAEYQRDGKISKSRKIMILAIFFGLVILIITMSLNQSGTTSPFDF